MNMNLTGHSGLYGDLSEHVLSDPKSTVKIADGLSEKQ
jgi:hypothetical protein